MKIIVLLILSINIILSIYIIKQKLNCINADITKLKTDKNISKIMKENKRIINKMIKDASENGNYKVTIFDGDYYYDSLINKHEITNLFDYEDELNSLINELELKGYRVDLIEEGKNSCLNPFCWGRSNKKIKISWGEENEE